MVRMRNLVVGGVIVLLVLAGSGYLAVTNEDVPKPSAGVQDFGDWGTVTDQRTEVVTTFWTTNPYPVDVTTGNSLHVDYSLSLNGVTVADGTRETVELPRGNTTQTQSTYVENDRLKRWWVNFIEADETIHATASGNLRVTTPVRDWSYRASESHTQFANRTPILDSISHAAERTEGEYVRTRRVDTGSIHRKVTIGAEVQDAHARWGRVTGNRTTVSVRFRIHNPSKTVPIVVDPTGLRMRASVNGNTMFRTGSGVLSANASKRTLLRPEETREVVIPVTMDNEKVDDWFRSHVKNGERSTIAVHTQLVVDPIGVGKPIRVPDGDGISYRCSMQTAIFEDNQTAKTTCG
ncbi:LEA type 2 family protein [Haladaptatus sp. CMAA 1911]|uniref:LEA type 2 family protein n=1 Tax=unclassified Haladaptatus TaxID=2622732 RepID=UPI0037549891